MFNQIESYIPDGFKKTTDIKEMFDINQMPPNSVGYLYNVGLPNTNLPTTYTMKNNTVNAKLRITLVLPFYLMCDKGNIFTIDPESNSTFSILFNELETKKHGKGTYTDKMDIKIIPTDYDRVVLLRTTPIQLPLPSATPTPTPTITTQPTTDTPSGKVIVSWSTNPVYELIDDPSHSGYQITETRNENYGVPFLRGI